MPFKSKYRLDNNTTRQQPDVTPVVHLEMTAPGIGDFLSLYSDTSFNNGLYRIHAINEMPRWTTTVADAFPEFKDRIFCFSYDWLGRHFAVDFCRHENGHCLILMFEPGTGQALEIPATFKDFHDVELVNYQNEALATDFYNSWLDAGGSPPNLSQCIGYKKPLILGGEDIVDNLELIDLDVYWSISGQLFSKIRNLPTGTKIRDIHIQ